ncbi:MAG: GNAT family N-acetyltransferase [Bacteroidota bacterium]|nr:GNAT family N-acetyltransferase [Bacteroidota bacterium]MDP3145751.1 GNAT family N-acetyltransferase [Bacteroidota bacterium]MDP3556840.1 GNAT family N-acetyltransferase [Bacteroidota bacterium]
MISILETERLLLREILPADKDGMFELDKNPEVHRFLGNTPVKDIEQVREVIQFIRQQYTNNGIGRFAIIEKSSNKFIGWCGLKLFKETVNNHTDFYDLGYRLIPKYWNQGYATEASKAWLNYGFETMKLNEIYAMTDSRNLNSNKVLKKLGFNFIEKFDFMGDESDWFKITKK